MLIIGQAAENFHLQPDVEADALHVLCTQDELQGWFERYGNQSCLDSILPTGENTFKAITRPNARKREQIVEVTFEVISSIDPEFILLENERQADFRFINTNMYVCGLPSLLMMRRLALFQPQLWPVDLETYAKIREHVPHLPVYTQQFFVQAHNRILDRIDGLFRVERPYTDEQLAALVELPKVPAMLMDVDVQNFSAKDTINYVHFFALKYGLEYPTDNYSEEQLTAAAAKGIAYAFCSPDTPQQLQNTILANISMLKLKTHLVNKFSELKSA